MYKDQFKIVTPRPGWARILWSSEEQLPDRIIEAMKEAAKIPGIELYVNYLDIPDNAKHLDSVCVLNSGLPFKLPVKLYNWVYDCWGTRELYTHQYDSVYDILLSRSGGLLLADEMGLGKTATAIAATETYLQQGAARQRALVIGPSFSREVWRSELLAMGAIDKPDDLCVIRTRDIDHTSYNPKARWTFIHYEIAHAWRSGLLYDARNNPSVCIIDEIHWIKNGRAQRSKAAKVLSSTASLRIGLTGTPLENRPSDLWNPLTTIVGANTFGSPLDFRKRYSSAVYTGYGWEDGDPSNIDELKERLETCYLRRTTEEVGLDIPPLTHSSRIVHINQTARREHDDILRQVPLDKLVRAVLEGQVREVLPMLTRLRQATSQGKLSATVELVSDFLEQGESVVVFCQERATARDIAERTDSWLATGEFDIDQRDAFVQEFQEKGGGLITTYGALKEGVTLHRARIVVLHDLDWRITTILQAVKRINRIGQKRACQAIWVLAEGSADVVLAKALLTKAQLTEEILGIKDGTSASAEVNLKDLVGEQDFEKRTMEMLEEWEKLL